jgi:uroporphyrinogen decarboxylase
LAFSEFSAPYLAHIAAHLPARLAELGLARVPMIVFPKGAWYALSEVREMGYDVVGLDWLHRPADAVAVLGDKVAIQGNADPGVLYGSREAITATVESMFTGFSWKARRKGWICNLGHGITPFVNPDDLRFYFEEVHRVARECRAGDT